MTQPDFILPNPPVIEAVLDVDCEFPPGQQINTFENQARECFRDHYPKLRTQFIQEHQIKASGTAPAEISVKRAVQAFQFLTEDEKQILQIRVQGFSFNRLAPYSSLDDYLPEIERTWHSFLRLLHPVQIQMIRLRYINRFLIPLVDDRIELEQYLEVGPRLPKVEGLQFVSFLNQHSAIDISTGHKVNIILTMQPPENGKLPIIFDNCVFADVHNEPDNWAWINGKIQELRSLKNRIFRKTLTQLCMNLFQPA